MSLEQFDQASFPETSEALTGILSGHHLEHLPASVVIRGGTARSALLEATSEIIRPVRDLDIAILGRGDEYEDIDFQHLNYRLHPVGESYQDSPVFRFEGINKLLLDHTDFTINQSVIVASRNFSLHATHSAVLACKRRLITPTPSRIAEVISLKADHEANPDNLAKQKLFKRRETDMPARAAYFAAVFEASGYDFAIDMDDHPVPTTPADSHTFYLGLMVNKALQMDEIERAPGDISATLNLFDLYGALRLTEGVSPTSPEDIVAYCETVNEEHPQLKFGGSQVAEMVRHTDKKPAPKVVDSKF